MAAASAPLTADALAALGGEAAHAAQAEAQDWETMSAASLELIGGISKGAMTELKAFSKPPRQVHDVMGGVAIALGEANTEWAVVKKMISDMRFSSRIRAFDPTTVDAGRFKPLKEYMRKTEMDPENVGKASKTLPPFVMWLQAVDEYG